MSLRDAIGTWLCRATERRLQLRQREDRRIVTMHLTYLERKIEAIEKVLTHHPPTVERPKDLP